MKFAVIGSNSFSGAHFTRYLLARGHAVLATSRSEEPELPFRPYAQAVKSAPFDFEQLDLNKDLPSIIAKLDTWRPDYVVNFASQSMVAESWANPDHWFQTNVLSTIRFHEALRTRTYLKTYTHISTPEVYGSCSGAVLEDAPYAPSTPYAVSRAAADMSLLTYFRQYQFPVVFTRAANVYGPGQQLYRIIPKTILSIKRGIKLPLHGGGTSRRSFIHIEDVCEGTFLATTNGKLGEIYHLSTPELISIRDLVEQIARRLNTRFEDCVEIVGDRAGKDSAYWLDSTKMLREFDWKAKIGLVQGLEETIDWANEHSITLDQRPLVYEHKA